MNRELVHDTQVIRFRSPGIGRQHWWTRSGRSGKPLTRDSAPCSRVCVLMMVPRFGSQSWQRKTCASACLASAPAGLCHSSFFCTALGVWRPGLPPAASSSAFRLDKLTAWWHRGPRLSVIALKVYVCMLLLIELLGASSPLVSVLSLPEILRRVRRHPYGPGEASLPLHAVIMLCLVMSRFST